MDTTASMTAAFPCSCCGFIVFDEPAGSFEICPLCGWQDDPVQIAAPGYAGGANKDSLCTAQRRAGWHELRHNSLKGYRRAPDWRPVKPEECTSEAPHD